MLVPRMLDLAEVMAESRFSEEQVFDEGILGKLVFLVVVAEVGACRVPAPALSHFMAGADTYSADAMPEHYSGALSGQWTIKRDRLRILAKSWNELTENAEEIDRLDCLAAAAEAECAQKAIPIVYHLPLHDRLEPRTSWQGSRLANTDLFTLEEAASMASKHAGTDVTTGDFLRAAGRGEIVLRAICRRAVTMHPIKPSDKPLLMPERSIPTLPLEACRALSNTRQATWRAIDGFENDDFGAFQGSLCRFSRWQLASDEPDLVTTPEDCRVTGYDVHALADAFGPNEAKAKLLATLKDAPLDETSKVEAKGGEGVSSPLPPTTGQQKRWTDELIQEARNYRAEHGLAQTAEKFVVSESRLTEVFRNADRKKKKELNENKATYVSGLIRQ